MKLHNSATLAVAALAIGIGAPAVAQTTTKSSVTTSNSVQAGVPATTVKAKVVQKTKTRRAKRVLGVKVGHKSRVHKTVRNTTVTATGDTSTQVKDVQK